jgi:hypothetical protein
MDFLHAFRRNVSDNVVYEYDGSNEGDFGFVVSQKFPATKTEATLKEVIDKFFEDIDSILLSTIGELGAVFSPGAVTVRFDFPDAVKVPCEQYFHYFVQFLKDAGVGATGDFKHDAGGVLFTVTPTDPSEALDKIRQALAVYLRIPANPGMILAPDYNQPLEVQRFIGEIQHLQSQLTYANLALRTQEMAIRSKEAIIEAKNETIGTMHIALRRQPVQEITASVFVDSVREVVGESKKQDCETILGGAVEITKYEGDGFNVNTAQVFRWMKGLFAKKPK